MPQVAQEIMTPLDPSHLDLVRRIAPGAPTITPQTPIQEIEPEEITLVVDETGSPVGFVKAVDLARALRKRSPPPDLVRLDRLILSAYEEALDGIVVVDAAGKIVYLNKAYEVMLNIRRQDAVGRHVTEVIPNSRMHITATSGIPEVGRPFTVAGQDVLVERHPIFDGDKVVGAIGRIMFRSLGDLKTMVERLELLQKQVDYYERQLNREAKARYTFEDMVGAGPAMTQLKALAKRAAQSNSTVLILGESGTGKELLAHAIHNASRRASHPFVKVNCAAIPKDLLESELFGYEAGAFSGANKNGKPGKFEQANRGTIFLDEVADMPLEMQAKVLRAIQEREIQKVGGTREIHVDVRIIAATNKNLLKMVAKGEFREDLYYRLAVIELEMPALRERQEDLPVLVRSLMERTCREAGIEVKALTAEAMRALQEYPWPGNVRELVHTLERLVNTVDQDLIDRFDLPPYVLHRTRPTAADPPERSSAASPLRGKLNETGRELILKALEQSGGNKLRAAELLGIHRSVLYRKMKHWGIT
ncbi:MAG: sigma 54-interacting transcriptional regulator [Bacillota bacterium]